MPTQTQPSHASNQASQPTLAPTGESRAAFLCWLAAGAALLVAGPIVGFLASFDTTSSGTPHATVFTAISPIASALAVFGAAALAIALGLAVRTVLSARFALLSAGLVFAWLAFAQARVETLPRTIEPSAALVRLSLDGLMLLLLATPVAWLILAPAQREGRFAHHRHPEPEPEKPLSANSLLGVGVALVASLAGAFIVAQSEMRGQTLAAGLAGGVLAGMAVRLALPTAARLAPVVGVLLGAVAGPLIALFLLPNEAEFAVRAGDIFNAGRMAPADWVVGAFTGVAAGQYFALSMVDHAPQHGNTKR
jgi:hypothetical protein